MLFLYKAIEQNGSPKEGEVESVNADAALATLQRRGLIVTHIEPYKEKFSWRGRFTLFNRVSNKDIVVLSRQISTLFEAQVSALRVFKLIASQTDNLTLRYAISTVADDLSGGASISEALSKHPHIFSDFYVNMVKAGEESGRLDQTFVYLADYLERNYEVTSKATGALVYPALVVVVFVVVMILMFTLIIPKIGAIVVESGQDLPIYTLAILAISNFLVKYGIFLLGVLIIGGYLLYRYSRTAAGSLGFDSFKLGIPVVGDLYQKLYLSRIADNIHTLVSSGVTMVKSIDIASKVVGNQIYKKILEKALDDIKGGKQLSTALAEHPEIPFIMVQMVRVGEETGELGSVLKTMSTFYQREVVRAVDTLVSLIEPALIVALGLGVGILIAAVLVPIYNVTQAF